MAICGERYKYLAVTVSGYNFDNPYGLFAVGYTDYAEWHAVAERLVGLVNEHLAALQVVELAKNPAMPKFQALAADRTNMLRHFEDLPGLFGMYATKEPLDQALSVVAEAICLLEQTDNAIESYGEVAPEVPGVRPPEKPPFKLPELPKSGDIPWYVWLIGGTAAAAMIGGLYYRTRGPQTGQRGRT